jgi:signal transduction histidine kinase/DNA-binding response OmpR family regulator
LSNNTEVTRLLLITDESPAPTLQTALSSAADFMVRHRTRISDARGALVAGAFEVCLFAPRRVDAEFCNEVATARSLAPALPLVVVLATGTGTDAQQKLLTAGADLVLFQPIEPATLAGMLERFTRRRPSAPAGLEDTAPLPAGPLPHRAAALSSALEVLRDFSQVLGYSLDSRQLTQHFIQKLREVVGIARIAIFLEPGPVGALPAAPSPDSTSLPCAAAVGLPADLVECFALSRKSGLGRQLTVNPQILRAPTATMPPLFDDQVAREFDVLGGRIAIPVNDRERTLGVAVLGGRITGGEFSDEELLLVYHLLEELGLAIKNSWLHHQLVGSHRLFASVLDGLTVGALVAGPGGQVMYTNRALVRFLRGDKAVSADLSDLPPAVAAKLREVIDLGVSVEPFFHEATVPGGPVYRATVIPLRATAERLPQTAMLLLEDFTRIRAAQRAEIESSNLKLISLIARRFAHEIRNSLVPLTTHEQLFDAEIGDPEFRESLKTALSRETQRIQRFTDQMLLLDRSDQPAAELAPLDEILHASFEKSRAYAGGAAELEIKSDLPPVMLRCNRASLAHAFQEIFLNGLQSAGENRLVTVALNATPTADGRAELLIHVRDSGGGFTPESIPRATEPFFTTRNTGVGLGLTIARRVIEAHQGSLEVHSRASPADSDLTIRLPLPR